MLSKIKELSEAARLKAGVWLRERKERAEEKKATAAAMSSEHGHGRFFLLHVPAMATICAAVVEWYWAILFCIESTGAIDWNYRTTFGSDVAAASTWNFAFETHWPIFLGLVCATIPIVMLSMVWLPVQFAMRGSGMWRRGTVIAVGVLANILVIVSGTVVMNGNRQEQVRADLVVEQQAQANRGAIEAQIAAVNDDLARLTDRRINNEYAATAANVGAEAYRAQYMSPEALARSPESRRDIIVRALGAAERADALRAERAGLFQQLAQAPTEAAVAANVEDEVGAGLNTFAQVVEVWRPPFVAVICCLIGIFGAWWVLALMQGLNPRDVLRSGWADEGHRIEDLRSQPSVVPEPMKAAREAIYDAETGEELTHVRATWRKKPKRKGKPERVETAPDIPPDETGVRIDGGNRIAVGADGLGGVMESVVEEGLAISEQAVDAKPEDAGGSNDSDNPAPILSRDPLDQDQESNDTSQGQRGFDGVSEHPEPSEMSEEDLAALYELAASDPEQSVDSEAQHSEAEQESEQEHNEPQTNPARLIAPVAAE